MSARAIPTLLAAAALLLAGCGRAERPPRTAIPDSLLVRALADVHVAGALAAQTGRDADSLRAEALAALGLEEADLAAALDAYVERPEALLRLYERVVNQLLLEQSEVDPTLPPPPY